MKDPLIKRIRFVGLRFTREEFDRIEKLRKNSTTPEISEFIRRCIFEKPITVRQRNASLDDFMGVMIKLKSDLSAIGNNFNQAVRQLNTFNEKESILNFIRQFESDRGNLAQQIELIHQQLNKISDQWLQ